MSLPAGPVDFELITVKSGARSLRSTAHGETFHPVIGPMDEAEILHIRQHRLAERTAELDGPFIIWDVGLGAAANSVAVLQAVHQLARPIQLHSFEKDLGALHFALQHADELPYLLPHVETIRSLLDRGAVSVGCTQWILHTGNFRALLPVTPLPAPHAILFDPYSPASNPELWSLEAFQELYQHLSPEAPCLLTNYTRSTAIRVALLLAGFYVGHGNAVAEKDQTTVASNTLALLQHPLDAIWLQRAFRSTRSSPPRDGVVSGYPISEQDWQTLIRHPQFS